MNSLICLLLESMKGPSGSKNLLFASSLFGMAFFMLTLRCLFKMWMRWCLLLSIVSLMRLRDSFLDAGVSRSISWVASFFVISSLA